MFIRAWLGTPEKRLRADVVYVPPERDVETVLQEWARMIGPRCDHDVTVQVCWIIDRAPPFVIHTMQVTIPAGAPAILTGGTR